MTWEVASEVLLDALKDSALYQSQVGTIEELLNCS